MRCHAISPVMYQRLRGKAWETCFNFTIQCVWKFHHHEYQCASGVGAPPLDTQPSLQVLDFFSNACLY